MVPIVDNVVVCMEHVTMESMERELVKIVIQIILVVIAIDVARVLMVFVMVVYQELVHVSVAIQDIRVLIVIKVVHVPMDFAIAQALVQFAILFITEVLANLANVVRIWYAMKVLMETGNASVTKIIMGHFAIKFVIVITVYVMMAKTG